MTPSAIWQMAWPQLVIMYFFLFTWLADIWTAGRINADVQAVLGIIGQCIAFMQVVATAASSAATAAISQSLGALRVNRAKYYILTTLLLTPFAGLCIIIPAFMGTDDIFRLLCVPDSLLSIMRGYWHITLLTIPAQFLLMSSAAIFRSVRKVKLSLWTAGLSCIGNIFGNLGFGLGYFGLPAYGYSGIAWTTFTMTTLGALGNCLLLYGTGYLRFAFMPDKRWLKKGAPYLARVAFHAGASQFIWNAGYLLIFIIAASLPHNPVAALAGLTAGLRVEALLFLPAVALSMTVSVIVGNALGKGQPEEAKRLALRIILIGSCAMSFLALLLWPFRADLAGLLVTDPAAHEQATTYLSYNLLATPFSIASTIMGGVMTGSGAARYNLFVFGSTFWLVRLPLAWLLGIAIWKSASGIFAAMLVSQIIQSCIMFYVLMYRNWARFAMRKQAPPSHTAS